MAPRHDELRMENEEGVCVRPLKGAIAFIPVQGARYIMAVR